MPDRWTEAGRRSRVVNDWRSPMPTDAGNRAFVQVGLLREPVAAVGLHDLARRRQLAERGANGASADPGLLRDHRRCFRAGLQRRQNLGLVRATGGREHRLTGMQRRLWAWAPARFCVASPAAGHGAPRRAIATRAAWLAGTECSCRQRSHQTRSRPATRSVTGVRVRRQASATHRPRCALPEGPACLPPH